MKSVAPLLVTCVLLVAELGRAEPAAVQISAGYGDTCVRKIDGTAWCWGFNGLGDLGNGSTTDSAVPVQVSLVGGGVVEVSAGQDHVCARKTDGTLWCWGYDFDGELGDGNSTGYETAVQVTPLGTAVVQVSAGSYHTCARTSDGKLWCWGSNDTGQLGNGDGTHTTQYSPVQVTSLGTSVVEVSAGYDHTCARLASGAVWCWGGNSLGQLGNNSTTDSPVPVPATGLSGAVEVSANDAFTCARVADGSLWCWGGNTDGELGINSVNNSLIPVQVASLGHLVAQVSAGDNQACARLTDGTLWCWGSNFEGDVGDGSGMRRLAPVQVTALGNSVAEVTCGVHTCARETNGTVWCWGHNANGQLGDTTTTSRPTPVEAPILTAPTSPPAVPAGDWRMMAALVAALIGVATRRRRRDARA